LLLDASGLEPGLYEGSLRFHAGANHAIASLLIQLTVQAAEPAQIGSVKLLANGSFLLNFTGTSGFTHRVLASTNIAAPLPDWLDIGAATQTAPGQFQFTDPAASSFPQRFYRVRTP
jgi:hypothetical protein